MSVASEVGCLALTLAISLWTSGAQAESPLTGSEHPGRLYVVAEGAFAAVDTGDPFVDTSITGHRMSAALGVAGGVRLFPWTLGIHARVAPFGPFTLMETDVEAGYHLTFGRWEPYLAVHGGYARAFMTGEVSLADPAPTPQGYRFETITPPSPDGVDVGASLGVDYYVTHILTLGAEATLDALFLSTKATTFSLGVMPGRSMTGSASFVGLHAGAHFDL